MKKVFLILCVSAAITACGGSSKTGGNDTSASANQTAKAAQSDADTNANKTGTETASVSSPGAKLIAGSDCSTCHKVEIKVIGPAFKEIAAKYPATDANIDTLTNKVIKGGKGNWGDTPMIPHPNLAPADVKQMIKYILSLK